MICTNPEMIVQSVMLAAHKDRRKMMACNSYDVAMEFD